VLIRTRPSFICIRISSYHSCAALREQRTCVKEKYPQIRIENGEASFGSRAFASQIHPNSACLCFLSLFPCIILTGHMRFAIHRSSEAIIAGALVIDRTNGRLMIVRTRRPGHPGIDPLSSPPSPSSIHLLILPIPLARAPLSSFCIPQTLQRVH